jgi:hypothetical protein
LKKIFTKIAVFFIIGIIVSACNAEKRVPIGKKLLVKNTIIVNEKPIKQEEVYNQLYQKPNSTLLFGLRFRLNLYNLANLNPDSTYQAKFKNHPGKYERKAKWLSAKQVDRLGKSFYYYGIHDFLKTTGEPPVILDTKKTEKSVARLKYYYKNEGFFNVKATSKIDSVSAKRAQVNYAVLTGNAYFLDSLKTTIQTPVLDSLCKTIAEFSFLKSGNQYKYKDFENEKTRIATHFRNNGAYLFQPNYVTFDIDTINKKNKANVNMVIKDFSQEQKEGTQTTPFKIYKISDVNIYTDYSAATKNAKITDSIAYNGFRLFGREKIKYKPHAITDAVFITKGSLFADNKTVLTTRYLNNLKIFNYPTIQYAIDKRDATSQSLIANVYLNPRKKFNLRSNLDFTHSNIQTFGISFSPSLTIRNVFNGAETVELTARYNIGASQDLANPDNKFFNVLEYGLDLKLNIPRILMPFGTERIIPKSMIPSTLIAGGFAKQQNIGLDKENFSGAISYNWSPKKEATARFDLLNVLFVRNLNPDNYFNVYRSSYYALNKIAQNPLYAIEPTYFDDSKNLKIEKGTTGFTNDVLNGITVLSSNTDYRSVKSIEERRSRLTENNFILASSFAYSKTTKKEIQDNAYYLFRTKIESAGNLLSLIADASKLKKNRNDRYEIFNLEYSQYLKTELDYVKYWDMSRDNIIAVRSFFGIAIPFGNSNSIPFSRSFFSGGSNDNRGWQPYSLGPGSSGATSDFNEANMKIALSAEYRFKILNSLKGALFADAGNIWNVFDNVTDEKATFKGLNSLQDIALGSGFGLRYDFSFFVLRFDFGFKTYNPAEENNKRWFRDYNFANSVLNFGINYPF